MQVDENVTGAIEKGFLVFIGVSDTDDTQTADRMIKKMLGLRVFEDENHKTNLSLSDVNGSLLLVSQFTLYGDCTHGNRPSFLESAPAKQAQPLYESFATHLRAYGISVECGVFGADMTIEPVCDGPVTILLDTQQLRHSKV